MEANILKELEAIYRILFVIMCAVLFWAIIKGLTWIQNLVEGFKKAWDAWFDNSMCKYLDLGEYNKIIDECKEKLKKYPNHSSAIWFLAKAYYYKEENELSKKYFEKAIYLAPSWEEDAKEYLGKLNER